MQFRAGTLHFTRLRPGGGHPADSVADLPDFKSKGLSNPPHHPRLPCARVCRSRLPNLEARWAKLLPARPRRGGLVTSRHGAAQQQHQEQEDAAHESQRRTGRLQYHCLHANGCSIRARFQQREAVGCLGRHGGDRARGDRQRFHREAQVLPRGIVTRRPRFYQVKQRRQSLYVPLSRCEAQCTRSAQSGMKS